MDKKTYIANPIYDVVFRYLMEDNKIANLFLSAIINENIEELVFAPTTYSRKIGDGDSITVIRMDFSARIKQADGTEKVVIIELQKAKYYHQTMRFRRYLGKQYQNPENINEQKVALPVYPIYIIGDAFTEHVSPVIKIKRSYIDVATQEVIHETHPFIEALTHDSIIIQIPYLKGSRRTTLEHFLSIFDQSLQVDEKGHVLALEEEDYPEHYRSVVRRLNKAWQSPKIEEDMNMEDEVLDEFNKKDVIIAAMKKEAEEQRQRAEEEKRAKHQLIENLYNSGQSIASIAQLAQMTEQAIKSILNVD